MGSQAKSLGEGLSSIGGERSTNLEGSPWPIDRPDQVADKVGRGGGAARAADANGSRWRWMEVWPGRAGGHSDGHPVMPG